MNFFLAIIKKCFEMSKSRFNRDAIRWLTLLNRRNAAMIPSESTSSIGPQRRRGPISSTAVQDGHIRSSASSARSLRPPVTPSFLPLINAFTASLLAVALFITLWFVVARPPSLASFWADVEFWSWDHNQNPKGHHSVRLLILQHAESKPAAEVLEVTARVNRAYARNWGYDYVRVFGSTRSWDRGAGRYRDEGGERLHFALLLQRISQTRTEAITGAGWRSVGRGNRVQEVRVGDDELYDSLLVLRPDAMLVDLDSNILQMFDSNYLIVTVEHKREIDVESSIDFGGGFFWNLQHSESDSLLRLWLDEMEETMATIERRGIAITDLAMSTLGNVLNKYYTLPEQKELLLSPSHHSAAVFAGNIKFFRSKKGKIAWLEEEWALACDVLQQTSDQICFKFYPKCDLVA